MSRFYPILPKALLALFLLTCVCEYTTAEPRRPEDPNQDLDEENILANSNLSRGRYYNYYERGSLLLAQDHYQSAKEDFREALRKRPRDQWDARTYGMHFADYFPHRELGVAYCLQGEHETDVAKKKKLFRKAICQLKISLNQVESSKAKFYLNRAMAGFWKATGTDITPPAVGIANDTIDRWQDQPTLYINEYVAILEIRAWDNESFVGTVWVDSFVGKVRVDRTKLFIESAEKIFERDTVVNVDASDKEKTFVVTAVDLAGNESWPVKVRLIVDTVRPLAVARVHADKATLLGARIPVDIVARDDRGLKSVRVGEDPYDNRDCRGKVTWEGRFFAEPGDRSLDVEITDRAGNVTTMSVPLESGQPMSIEHGERLTVYNAPLYNSQSPWKGTFDVTQRGSGNILSHLVQFSTLETNSFPSHLGHEDLQEPSSNEYQSPEFVFPVFEYRTTTVPALYSGYFHQRQVTHANRLLEPKSIYGVIWAQLENEYSPKAPPRRFANREEANKEKWHKEFWNDKYIYSVNLAPLVNEKKPRDFFKDWDEVNNKVRDAMIKFELFDRSTGKSHPRFDSKALEDWKAAEMYRNLRGQRHLPQNIDKIPPQELACRRAEALFKSKTKEMESDLAFYGLVKQIKDEFEVKVNILDRDFRKERLFPVWIDIYGKIEDLQSGLIERFREKMPRLIGEIKTLDVQEKDIKVELKEDQRAFRKMCLQLYDMPGSELSPTFTVKCKTHVNDVNVSPRYMTAKIKKKNDWRYIMDQDGIMLVVSK